MSTVGSGGSEGDNVSKKARNLLLRWVQEACDSGNVKSALRDPEEVELFFDVGGVFVAGGEGGFALEGEGGGEAVDVGEIVVGFEFGSVARELDIRWDQVDRQLGNLRENMVGESGALVAPDGIVHLAPIDDAHEEFALAVEGELNELLDLFGAGTVFEEGHEGAGIENDTPHSVGRFTAFARADALRGEIPEPWSLCRGSHGDCG